MRGLGKRLRSGEVCIEPELKKIFILSTKGTVIDSLSYSELQDSDWGYIYEKHVAQFLINKGFQVDMHGLTKGFLDGGIDLIAKNMDDETIYIQCKYFINSIISKSRIEWILYNSSQFLSKIYNGKKLIFWLVVPSIEESFSSKKSKSKKISYPIAEYFLSKNLIQAKVKLQIHEIQMHR